MPERQMNNSSFFGILFSVCCFPFIKTMSHAIISTTPVRMAVPRFDSTPSIPILPRMDVRLANTAESTAYMSQLFFSFFSPSAAFFSIIRNVPAPISTIAAPFSHVIFSPRNMSASSMVRIVDDLSMGTTLLTSPS